MWQLHDTSRLIAHRSHVAHFRRRKQTFVLGIVVSNCVKQIDIFDRRQALDLEISQPPQVQTPPHRGMQPAVELRFLIPISVGLVSEVLQSAESRTRAYTRG